MLKNILHKIMSLPVMYDLLQTVFGVNKKKRMLRQLLSLSAGRKIVLDIGGGTGIYKNLWPADFQYVCLDYDLQKLDGFRGKYPQGQGVCSDASKLGFKPQSVDYVFCSSMSHHIPHGLLEAMVAEMSRVLKPDGQLVFIDAVSIPESALNRFLWRLDRGEYPHSSQMLESLIEKYFKIKTVKTFSIYYDYILVLAGKYN